MKHKILFLLLILVLLFVGFGLALLLASWLQKFASAPILTLRQAMQKVSEQRDYSVRVPHTTDDELGALTDGFNDMLAQIQIRDAELARYSSQLEEVVAARTRELAEANRRRIVWLENLARFLRHELKNTTVGVTSSLDLIERRAQSDRIAKYLERARSSVSFMKRLLDSVGGATTLEASFHTDPKSRLDLAELVLEHIDTYQNLYPNVELITDCDDNVEIEGNPTRLVQLMDKLVSNAVDHGAFGTPITVAVKKTDGQALLSVTDEGESLPEDKARMFELFVSLRHAERRDSDNLGLGLYIVKLIAEFHGGQVQAENLPGEHGAVFTVSFPLVGRT